MTVSPRHSRLGNTVLVACIRKDNYSTVKIEKPLRLKSGGCPILALNKHRHLGPSCALYLLQHEQHPRNLTGDRGPPNTKVSITRTCLLPDAPWHDMQVIQRDIPETFRYRCITWLVLVVYWRMAAFCCVEWRVRWLLYGNIVWYLKLCSFALQQSHVLLGQWGGATLGQGGGCHDTHIR